MGQAHIRHPRRGRAGAAAPRPHQRPAENAGGAGRREAAAGGGREAVAAQGGVADQERRRPHLRPGGRVAPRLVGGG